MRRKRYSSSDHTMYASSFRRARQTLQRISFYFRSTFDHPFVERHGLSASFPLSPVFVAECVLYTRGWWMVTGGRISAGQIFNLRYFRSPFLPLSFLLFLRILSSLHSLCYVWSLTGWIAKLLDWRTLNENVSGSFERPVLSLAASTGLLLFRETFFCAPANCFL